MKNNIFEKIFGFGDVFLRLKNDGFGGHSFYKDTPRQREMMNGLDCPKVGFSRTSMLLAC
jgi:hypothetical protein|nr:hypothetical protein [uncultured Limnohabitans sp.]